LAPTKGTKTALATKDTKLKKKAHESRCATSGPDAIGLLRRPLRVEPSRPLCPLWLNRGFVVFVCRGNITDVRQPVGRDGSSNHPEHVRAADLELAQRCRQGDAGAFEELYRAHAGRLFSLVYRMAGSAHDAEDLLQEVFLQVHRKLGSFKGESSLGTWLYRLAINHCLDFLRGRQARMARSSDSLDAEGADEPVAATPAVPTPVSRLDLERAIARLPDGCRAAFILHDVEGFEHNEVAKLLGVSEGTSKSQVHKARMKLRAMLSGMEAPVGAGPRPARGHTR